MIDKKKLTGYPIRSMGLVWLLIMCLCTACTSDGSQPGPSEDPTAASESLSAEETAPPTEEPDTEGPVISGVQTLTTVAGGTLSYRDGVTAVDDRDGPVMFQVDSSQVDLNTVGEYEVIYSAEDSSGNRTEVTATVVVTVTVPEPAASEQPNTQNGNATLENVNALADKILAQIIKDGMSQREKARAIYNYVNSHIKYVGSSDKSGWVVGAYTGFTTGRGDCYTYFACAKALLTRAGIPNVDLQRVGGATRHYWNLVNVGDGYYHFDTCPHPSGYSITAFLLTEDEVRAYTKQISRVRPNYYVYDYASCPVPVVGLSEEERNPQETATAEPTPEVPEEPAPEVTPEPTPEIPEEPAPEVTQEQAPDPAPTPAVLPEGQEG